MQARPWPNKLGRDVGEDAEVWKLDTGLDVCVFTDDDRIRHLFITDPLLDPVVAVELFSDNYFSRLTTIRFPVATTIITASDN